jgi:hypothetical protein
MEHKERPKGNTGLRLKAAASVATFGAFFLCASPEHINNISAPIPTAFTIQR